MSRDDASLRSLIARGGNLTGRFLHATGHSVALANLAGGSSFDCPRDELAGSAVLVATAEQLTAALAAIELDGVVRRLIFCPPDVPSEHISLIVAAAEVDCVVSDGRVTQEALGDRTRLVRCSPSISPTGPSQAAHCQTEWILLTSGTTGLPKLVVHTLASLTGAITPGAVNPNNTIAVAHPVWSTFYDIRRYGGLQIFFRAALGSGSLVLSSAGEATADFLARAGRLGVTHISGTPSHWRRALMSPAADRLAPQYVRLSGEIADQAILDDLRAFYRDASVGHAFASTEAGVAFEVNDGFAGFPAGLIGRTGAGVEMQIVEGSLRIRSSRTASGYLGDAPPLRSGDGFVDTGDILERRGERYYFVGRRGGIINVGGLKVHPEEVEAVINRHPAVRMSLVKARRNPFTGAVVVADVVVRPDPGGDADGGSAALQSDIMRACRAILPPHKVPAALRIVASLNVGAAGKLARRDA
jgi:acyl-CoA synthetase (AMP-forming)/AMP-acid ligase II